jgi:GH18 family chitinase
VISDPAKRATLVSTLATYVKDRKIDGIDVMMTDIGNDNGAISTKSIQSVGPFISELKAALPANSIVTATVTTNYMHWDYPSLLHATWINVHTFETGANVGPGATRGQQSPLWYMNDASAIWINKGYPKSKLVLGIPAFGLRYNELDANGNNASWGSYDYIPYRNIISTSKDPDIHNKEYDPNLSKGVYFNGIPLVTQKAEFIRNNGFKGAYIWAGDYDTMDSKSLIKTIYDTIY